MNKLIAGGLLLAAAFSLSALAPTITVAQQASPGSAHTNIASTAVFVDVDAAIPSQIPLKGGAAIIFVRKEHFVGTEVDAIANNPPPNLGGYLQPIEVTAAPPGYRVVSAYRAVGTGRVRIDITHAVLTPDGQSHADSVWVIVQ